VYHLQNVCGVLLKPVNNLELNSLRMTIRKFFVRFFWHFDCYILYAYRNEEYFSYLCLFRYAVRTTEELELNIEWLLKNTADTMWVKGLQNFYSLNTMILEPFGANVQNWKTKFKTHIKIKSCITNCVLLQLSSLLRHRKVSFLTYISVPKFRYEIWPNVSFVTFKHYKTSYWFYILWTP
jgi:hypothetical protein